MRVGVFLTFLGFFLLTGSREELWADAKAGYKVAENWVEHDRADLGYAWPFEAAPGRGGKYWSPYGALVSLVHVPGARLQKLVREHWPEIAPMTRPITGHLPPAFAGALTCLLFFGLCRRLGVSTGVAGATTVILGTATMVWPYARDPLSEMLQTACFTGFFAALLDCERAPERKHAILLGIWAGLVLNSKSIYALSLLGGGLFLVFRLRRAVLPVIPWAAAAFAPFLALFLGWSWLRYGTVVDPAAAGNDFLFREKILVGLWGLFLSMGKSVLLYSPPLLLALAGLPALWRRQRAAVVAAAATIVPVVLVYARYLFWDGAHAWGPRYILFLQPVALLGLAVWLDERRLARTRAWQIVLVAGVLVAGVLVQVVGSAFWRGHWIRLSREVNAQWIGLSGRRGSNNFDDLFGVQWVPAHAPIDGQAWLLRHRLAGHPYRVALLDAPWRRYTTLDIDETASYDAARFDWWGLLWLEDFPRARTAGTVLLAGELALLAAGVWMWRRGRRA